MRQIATLSDKTLTSTESTYSLIAASLAAGLWVRRFWFKVTLTLARGGSASAHEPEAVAEVLSSVKCNHARLKCNMDGRSLMIVENVKNTQRVGVNPGLTTSATSYTLYVPFDPSPIGGPDGKKHRLPTSALNGLVFDIGLKNPFHTTDDVTTLTASDIRLMVEYADRGEAEAKPFCAIFERKSDIESEILNFPHTEVAMLLLGSRSFTSIDIESDGYEVAKNATPLDLDAKGFEHQSYAHTDSGRTTGGNQHLLSVPVANGSAENYTLLIDQRNDKAVKAPTTVNLGSKSGVIPQILVGFKPINSPV